MDLYIRSFLEYGLFQVNVLYWSAYIRSVRGASRGLRVQVHATIGTVSKHVERVSIKMQYW